MPKKGRTKNAQLQPQAAIPAVSDYDTDTVNPSDAPPLAPIPQRTNTELNLTVLRRYSPNIEHIVAIAPFAVVYTFSPDSQQWEKCGIEGTLFVCQLSGSRYTVIILNRKSLDNFITELKSADDVQITEQYVMLQATSDEGTLQIYGLWIFSDGDAEQPSTRDVVAQTIQSCAMQAQIAREALGAETDGADGHEDEQQYGMDGEAEIEQQIEEEEGAVVEQAGQRLDLLSLFGNSKPAQADVYSAQEVPQSQNMHATQHHAPTAITPSPMRQARFTSTADTEFFRSFNSPVIMQQQQRVPPAQTQQNALLDLFKK